MTDPQVLIGRVNDMADTVEVILSNLNAATRGFGSGSGRWDAWPATSASTTTWSR